MVLIGSYIVNSKGQKAFPGDLLMITLVDRTGVITMVGRLVSIGIDGMLIIRKGNDPVHINVCNIDNFSKI